MQSCTPRRVITYDKHRKYNTEDRYKRSRTTTQLTRSELRGEWDEAKLVGTDFRGTKRHAVINRNCTPNVGRTNSLFFFGLPIKYEHLRKEQVVTWIERQFSVINSLYATILPRMTNIGYEVMATARASRV